MRELKADKRNTTEHLLQLLPVVDSASSPSEFAVHGSQPHALDLMADRTVCYCPGEHLHVLDF